MSDFKDKMQKM